ncbi:calcium/calmodulin-dependent protein kinase type 1D-like [Bolinopsis microptera]|uniref:calcium/calmodulin-dependent protein kinase type 1D-like n=1 Tax=Bolinopsis microptera TaxID=2820187 RepID=UPI003079D48A
MGNKSSKSAGTQEFLKTKFPSKPTQSYDVGPTCRQSGWALSKRAIEKTTGETYIAEYCNRVTTNQEEVVDLGRLYQIFKTVNHPNMVKLHQVFKLSKEKYVFVTCNYQDSDLFDFIVDKTENSKITEEEAANYTHQLLLAVQHLHKLDIVHRDIKPEWAYFQDDDFTKILLHPGPFCTEPGNSTNLTKLCGTVTYFAPEIANGKEYGKAVDCWSLGVTVFVMLSGGMPFNSMSETETLEMVKRAEYEFKPEFWSTRSEEARDFVSGLMTVDPDKRMNCEQALQHPWITSNQAC